FGCAQLGLSAESAWNNLQSEWRGFRNSGISAGRRRPAATSDGTHGESGLFPNARNSYRARTSIHGFGQRDGASRCDYQSLVGAAPAGAGGRPDWKTDLV